MKVTFVSNYINHHQIPVSNVLYEHLGENYTFVQTMPMEEERVKLGWNPKEVPQYVCLAYEEEELCKRLIIESDVVIWGGLEAEEMLLPRLQAGKPVIRYSERLYKEGQWKAISPRGLRKKYKDHTKYRKAPVYLLCAGAFVASDFHIVRAYPDKMFRWGYFPACKEYDADALLAGKDCTEILWAARFIDWKHPEKVVEIARLLREKGKKFHITMMGDGPLWELTSQQIEACGLQEQVTLTGSKTPAEVRKSMEKAAIFLMTSDRKEGWGAVMNEAMNSGCVVVADRMEGAALYLIEQGVNGFFCKYPTPEYMAGLIEGLLDDKENCLKMGRKAYATIVDVWNANVAASRLLQMCESIAKGEFFVSPWKDGPCSEAPVIKERS